MIGIAKPFKMIFRSGDIARPLKKPISACRDLLPGILVPGKRDDLPIPGVTTVEELFLDPATVQLYAGANP
jgi:hypothetical protein